MNILKDNYTKQEETIYTNTDPYPRKIICEECGSELEYDESDLRMGAYGCVYIDCPLCGQDNMLEENEHTIELTKDNIEFPVHFHHTCKENGAVDVCNNDNIKMYINRAIEFFRKNKDEYIYYCETGNMFIVIMRHENDSEYSIRVTNNYYKMYIRFEEED